MTTRFSTRRFILGLCLLLSTVFPAIAQIQSTARSARFISQEVPTEMVAGQQYEVSVTMQNDGQEVWRRDDNYRLGSLSGTDPWGLGRVLLDAGDYIASLGEKTFQFQVTAPTTPGDYTFQWRMLQESVAWFGENTTERTITVVAPLNNIIDPGFEQGTLGPFTAGLSNGTLSLETNRAHVHSGNYALRHEAADTGSYTSPWYGSNPVNYGGVEQAFRLSTWVKAETANTQVRIFLFSLDSKNGNDLPYRVAKTFTVGTQWQEISLDYICPPERAVATVRLDNLGGAGAIVWWDDLKLVRLQNYIPNGSFEADALVTPLASASKGDVTLDTTQAYKGSQSLKLTATSGATQTTPYKTAAWSALLPVNGGETVTLAGYARADADAQASMYLYFLDASYRTNYGNAQQDLQLTDNWSYQELSTIVPEGASYVSMSLGNAGAIGTSAWWDELILTAAPSLVITEPLEMTVPVAANYEMGVVNGLDVGTFSFQLPQGAENMRVLSTVGPVSMALDVDQNQIYQATITEETDGIVEDAAISLSLQESTGSSTVDRSGAGRTANVHGASTHDGRFGWGMLFDGIDDYLHVPDPSNLSNANALTLSAWVKPAVAGDAHVISKKNSFELYITGKNQVGLALNTSTGLFSKTMSTESLPLDQWSHLAATYDSASGVVNVYVDGVLVGTDTHSGTLLSNYQLIIVGAETATPTLPFEGVIDEVDVFTRALNSSEVGELYAGRRNFDVMLAYDMEGNTYAYHVVGQKALNEVSSWSLILHADPFPEYEIPVPADQRLPFSVEIRNNDADTNLLIPINRMYTDDFGAPGSINSGVNVSCGGPAGSCEIIRQSSLFMEQVVHVGSGTPDGEYFYTSRLHVEPSNSYSDFVSLDIFFKIGLICNPGSPCTGRHLQVTGPGGEITEGENIQVDLASGGVQNFDFTAESVGTDPVTVGPVSLTGSSSRFTVTQQPSSPLGQGGITNFKIEFNAEGADPNQTYTANVRVPTDDEQSFGSLNFTIEVKDIPLPDPFFDAEYEAYGSSTGLQNLPLEGGSVDIGDLNFKLDGTLFPNDPTVGYPVDGDTGLDPRIHRRIVMRLHAHNNKVYIRNFDARVIEGSEAFEWNFRNDVLNPDPPTGSDPETIHENNYFHFDGILTRNNLDYLGNTRVSISFEAAKGGSNQYHNYSFVIDATVSEPFFGSALFFIGDHPNTRFVPNNPVVPFELGSVEIGSPTQVERYILENRNSQYPLQVNNLRITNHHPSNPFSLSGGGTFQLGPNILHLSNYSFNPSGLTQGTYTAEVSFTSDDPINPVYRAILAMNVGGLGAQVFGEPFGGGEVQINSDQNHPGNTFNFETIEQNGNARTLNFQIRNAGSKTISLTSAQIYNEDTENNPFSIIVPASATQPLGPCSSNCGRDFQVRLNSATAGTHSANVILTFREEDPPGGGIPEFQLFIFTVTGVVDEDTTPGPEGRILVKARIDGSLVTLAGQDEKVPINTKTNEFRLQVRNQGEGPLTISDILLSESGPGGPNGGPAFEVTQNGVMLNTPISPNNSAGNMTIKFTPGPGTDPTSAFFAVEFVVDETTSPTHPSFSFFIQGAGEPFHVEQASNIVFPDELVNYGNTQEGNNLGRQYTLYYDGAANLGLGGLTVPNGFTITQNLPGTLVGGSATSASFTVALRGDMPPDTYAGVVRFNYSGGGDTGSFAFDVRGTVVEGPNQPPNAVNDTVTTGKDTPITINVLANDSDPNNDTISLISNPVISGPSHGSAVRLSASQIRYTPDSGYLGSDSFTYRIQDEHGATDTAVVNITVEEIAPMVPTNVQATDGTLDHVYITWTTPADAEHFTIYRHTTNNVGNAAPIADSFSNPTHFTTSSYRDYTADGGVNYYYWVSARNDGGSSGLSASDQGHAFVSPEPDLAFASISVNPDELYPNEWFAWTIAVEERNHGSLPNDSMWVYIYDSADDTLDAGDERIGAYLMTPPYNTHPKVVNAGARLPEEAPPGPRFILFEIDANNDVAESNENNNVTPVSVTALEIEPPPTVPNFQGRIDGQLIGDLDVYTTSPTINFTWSTPSDPSGIDRYQIVVQPTGGPWLYQPHVFAPANSYTLNTSDLVVGTSYSIHIRAKNNAGLWGNFINQGTFTISALPSTVPGFYGTINGQNVDGLVINETSPDVVLNWQHASHPMGIERYQIILQSNEQPWHYDPHVLYPNTTHTISTTDLLVGSTYTIHIRAKGTNGEWGPFVNGGGFTVQ